MATLSFQSSLPLGCAEGISRIFDESTGKVSVEDLRYAGDVFNIDGKIKSLFKVDTDSCRKVSISDIQVFKAYEDKFMKKQGQMSTASHFSEYRRMNLRRIRRERKRMDLRKRYREMQIKFPVKSVRIDMYDQLQPKLKKSENTWKSDHEKWVLLRKESLPITPNPFMAYDVPESLSSHGLKFTENLVELEPSSPKYLVADVSCNLNRPPEDHVIDMYDHIKNLIEPEPSFPESRPEEVYLKLKWPREDHVIDMYDHKLPPFMGNNDNLFMLRDTLLNGTGTTMVSFIAFAPKVSSSASPPTALMYATVGVNAIAFSFLLLSFWLRSKKLVAAERITGATGVLAAAIVFFLMMTMFLCSGRN